MNLRLLVLAVIAAAACTVSLGSPAPATAHGDPLHQHGWNAAFMFGSSPASCYGAPLYNGVGTFSVAVPDHMTTPGGNQWVAFKAVLEECEKNPEAFTHDVASSGKRWTWAHGRMS